MKVLKLFLPAVVIFTAISVFADNFDVSVSTNMAKIAAREGDILQVFISLSNPSLRAQDGILYIIILDPRGKIYSFPSWGEGISGIRQVFPAGFELENYELSRLNVGEGIISEEGEYRFACGFFSLDGRLSGISVSSFFYRNIELFENRFDDNSYSVGDTIVSHQLIDLNKDGHLDIFVSIWNDLTYHDYRMILGIFINKGDGTYRAPLYYYNNGVNYNDLVIEDLDYDGYPDFAVSCIPNGYEDLYGGGTYLYFNNGDGTFGHPIHTDLWGDLFLDDLNNDGLGDILIDEPGNRISVLVNKGDRTFEAPKSFSVEGFNYAAIIDPLDFDNDGYPDLLLYFHNASEDRVVKLYAFAVYRNNGDGTFRNHGTYTLDGYSTIKTADLNNDTFMDIIVRSWNSTNQLVYLNKGHGTFGDPALYPVAKYYDDFHIIDLNNDGYSDLLSVGYSQRKFYTMLNNGDGSFAGETSYEAQNILMFAYTGDLDNDGYQDLVFSHWDSAGMTVFLNKGDGSFDGYNIYGDDFVSDFLFVDMNNDGYLDILGQDYWSEIYYELTLFINNKDGSFRDGQIYYVPFNYPSYYFTGRAISKSGDINGDGYPDLVCEGNALGIITVLPSNGDGTLYKPAEGIQFENYIKDIKTGDLNNDGLNDLLVTELLGSGALSIFQTTVMLNSGDENFNRGQSLEAGNILELVDVNNDEYPDILSNDTFTNTNLQVFLNDGDGTYADPQTFPVSQTFNGITSDDLNGDGYVDLILNYQGEEKLLMVLFNNGDGTFGNEATYDVSYWSDVTLADLNNDGYPDLIDYHSWWNVDYLDYIGVYLNDGTGTFTLTTRFDSPVNMPRIADIDNDGYKDLIMLNYDQENNSQLIIHPGNGDGTFKEAIKYSGYGYSNYINYYDLGDFNKDGLTDIIIKVDDGINVLLNEDNPVPSFELSHYNLSYFDSFMLSDMNNDDYPDIITFSKWAYYNNSNNISIILGNGDGTFSTETFIPVTTAGILNNIYLSDMNGDGYQDIIMENRMYSSSVNILYNNGGN